MTRERRDDATSDSESSGVGKEREAFKEENVYEYKLIRSFSSSLS